MSNNGNNRYMPNRETAAGATIGTAFGSIIVWVIDASFAPVPAPVASAIGTVVGAAVAYAVSFLPRPPRN